MSYNPRIITPRINPDENLNRFVHADKLLPDGCWNCEDGKVDTVLTDQCIICNGLEGPEHNGHPGWTARS